MKLVVCDDDAMLRGVVSKLATEAGHSVLAETDSATDAIDIEKPDFEGLEEVLAAMAAGAEAATPAGAERRRDAGPRATMPAAGPRTVSGVEAPHTFAEAVDRLELGDAVLVVHVAMPGAAPGWHGRLAGTDHLLAVARALRAVLRVQDRMSVAEPSGGNEDLVDLRALLLGGGRSGVESAFRRLELVHDSLAIGGVVSGGWALVEEGASGPLSVGRADDAARRSVGRPEGHRLWAG